MTIRAECESCYEQFNVRDDFAGRRVRCKACGEFFDVPDVEDYDARPARRPQRSSRGRRGSRGAQPQPWVFIAGGAAIAVVLAAIMLAVSGGGDENTVALDTPVQQPGTVATTAPDSPPVTANVPTPPASRDDLFNVAAIPVPAFPELGTPVQRLSGGETVYFVECGRVPQPSPGPGTQMKMRVYLPAGDHERGSIGCVLVGPAGTNLLVGNDMDADDYHDETLPYAQAGMAVIFYSLDGGVADLETASDAEFLNGYRQFKAACAGVVNGRNALEFALARLPQVDPEKIYCAGHSSAGTLSLLLAQHEPRIRRCIAYAPATDVELRLGDLLRHPSSRIFDGLGDFLHRSSPKTHTAKFQCPVFLFHARDDGNEPFTTTQSFHQRLQAAGKNATFVTAPRGGHYQSMIDPGIPQAINWLTKAESGQSAPTSTNPAPGIAATPAPQTPPAGFATPPTPITPSAPGGAVPIAPGSPVVVFEIVSFSGAGDKTAAARQALVRIPWARSETLFIDESTNEIVVGIRGRSVSTGAAKSLLQRAGFQIGSSSYRGSGR